MKIALTVWNGRIAPVFDVSRQLLVLTPDDEVAAPGKMVAWSGDTPAARLAVLRERGIKVLICGAISQPARLEAESMGIEVNGFIAGDVNEVLAAWRRGELASGSFAMPGCGGARRSCCRRLRNGNPW